MEPLSYQFMYIIYNLRCSCVAARSVESSFLSLQFSFPAGSASIDVCKPEISRLLKQVQICCLAAFQAASLCSLNTFPSPLVTPPQIRLMNDFQKEVTTFWIRHPEKWVLAQKEKAGGCRDVDNSCLSLLSDTWRRWLKVPSLFCPSIVKILPQDHKKHWSLLTSWPYWTLKPLGLKSGWYVSLSTVTSPILSLLLCWIFSHIFYLHSSQHGGYSRTVVLRLLESKYKSVVSSLHSHHGSMIDRSGTRKNQPSRSQQL